jgi:hypothetical protein
MARLAAAQHFPSSAIDRLPFALPCSAQPLSRREQMTARCYLVAYLLRLQSQKWLSFGESDRPPAQSRAPSHWHGEPSSSCPYKTEIRLQKFGRFYSSFRFPLIMLVLVCLGICYDTAQEGRRRRTYLSVFRELWIL